MNEDLQTLTLRTDSLKDQGALCENHQREYDELQCSNSKESLKSYCYALALFWVVFFCGGVCLLQGLIYFSFALGFFFVDCVGLFCLVVFFKSLACCYLSNEGGS